jgi:hypothetical protein
VSLYFAELESRLEILSSIVLEVAIGKSAELLLSGLRSAELEEVHRKLDALLLGEFRAACRILIDLERLGTANEAMLLDAMRLFELSAGRFDVLVEKQRQHIFPNFWARTKRFYRPKGATLYAVREDEASHSAELLALEDVSDHLVYEYTRFLCYIGALRASLLLSSQPLAPLKRERVKEIASDIRAFIEDTRSKLSTSYEQHGKIDMLEKLEKRYSAKQVSPRAWYPNSLGVMLQRKLVGWVRQETYEQYSERLRQEYLRTPSVIV